MELFASSIAAQDFICRLSKLHTQVLFSIKIILYTVNVSLVTSIALLALIPLLTAFHALKVQDSISILVLKNALTQLSTSMVHVPTVNLPVFIVLVKHTVIYAYLELSTLMELVCTHVLKDTMPKWSQITPYLITAHHVARDAKHALETHTTTA